MTDHVASAWPAQAGTIRAFLDRLRFLLFAAALAETIARAAAVAAVAVGLNAFVAERAGTSPWAAFALALVGTAALASVAVQGALRLRLPGRERAARRVEALARELRNDVESSLELGSLADAGPGAPMSPPLVGALLAGTSARLAHLAPRHFVPLGALRRSLGLCAVAIFPLVVLLGSGAGIPDTAARALVDPRTYWPLGRITLAVEPGDARLARGSALVVRARAAGARPARVQLGFEDAVGGAGVLAMERGTDGTWTWRFGAVVQSFRYRALAGAAVSPWYRVTVADPPAAGNFEILYTYPAYSGLGARRVEGSGELEALRGTTADISFTSSADLARATLIADGVRAAAQPAGARRSRVQLYLNGERSYRLELEDVDGLRNTAGPEYAIRYLPDASPAVDLLEPKGSLEADPRAAILLRYRAADDYGLSRLAVVARSAGGERRWPLPLAARARSAGGEYEWDLGQLAPEPGAVVAVFVEAADNDTITGPKVSASAVLEVRIADPRKTREEIHESMKKLTDDLVELLGAELEAQGLYAELERRAEQHWEEFPWEKAEEASARQEAARNAASRAEERAARLTETLERSPESGEETFYQAELIRRGLGELRERQLEPMRDMAAGFRQGEASAEEARQKTDYLERTAGEAAEAAEQLALMAESMQRESGMAAADRSAREMADAEEKLFAGLEKLSPGDRKAAEEVLRQLDEIEQGLRELAEALLRENKELPEEFLNSDALKNLDLGEVLGDLDRIRDLLAKGDIAGAKRAAKDLAAKLADLRNRLRQASDEFDEKVQQALARLQGGSLPELEKIVEKQKAVLKATEQLERAAGPRLESVLERMAAERDTQPPPAESDILVSGEKELARSLGLDEVLLRARAERLAAEFATLRALLPFLPAEVGRRVEEAAGYLGEAGERIGLGLPRVALPPERAALADLQRAAAATRQALDELSQMQGMRQGGAGLPMAFGRGGSGGNDPFSDARRGRRAGGRRGTDVRNFAIPGRQDHRVPKIFREEILKSLRDGYPPQYEERIRDYYQRIAE